MDSVKEMYMNLMKQGMTLPEIDGMDILFYFELIRFTAKEKKEKIVPIDHLGFM